MADDESKTGGGVRSDPGPDVLFDVPALDAEEVDLKSEEVRVRVSFAADLGAMVKINVGLEAEAKELDLQIKGLQSQAQLKARLDNVREIFSEVLTALENTPGMAHDLMGKTDQATQESEKPDKPPREALKEEPQAENNEPNETPATQAARERAERLGVDLDRVEGTGVDGRIVVKDVVEAGRR
jgi:pyruvate/2-oxoglutarate dehydrogenase complex dihydrolipoamide acyltransferase (E2) component